MNKKSKVGRARPAISIALILVALSGCATQTSSVRSPVRPGSEAPDLLNVSAIAPPISAELVARDAATRRRVSVAGKSESTSASAIDRAVVPTTGAAAAQDLATPARSTSESNRIAGPIVDANAGLMGPSPGAPTPAATTPPPIPQSRSPYPIDLATALQLADVQNPTIGEARVLILSALAERLAARALLLPYLNAGMNYHDHTGPLQRSSGAILPLTEQSFYFGGGARTLAAESVAIPAVNIFSPLTDAIFEPLAAQQRVIGARFNASDTANKVLLEVASLYIDLIGAEATVEARRQIAADADQIADSVAAYAETGQGRRSDADRADANRRLFQAEIQKAEERVAVASALLAQRLNLDPSAQLRPVTGPLQPIELINPETPSEELIRAAVAQRPDLAAREALVSQAEYRVKQEKARPLLPTIWMGFSGGVFGGGSNFTATPLGSFAGRTDFDIRAYWTLLNFGAGNALRVKQRKAQAGQAMADRSIVLNEIRAEVSSSLAKALALQAQVTIARYGLKTAEDGFRQDQIRLRESLSLPIEALDSLRLLSDARVALIEAITRANRTQFALFVSLGAPPPLAAPAAIPPQSVLPSPVGGGD